MPFAGHGSCCLQAESGLGSLDLLDQLGNDLVQIADDAVGGNVEDGGVLVLVDGDDVLGVLHTGNVLDGTGDAQRNVDAGMHGLAGLADLMVSAQPALVGDGTGSTDNAAQSLSQLLGQLDALLGVSGDAAADGDDRSTSFSALFLMSST